MIDCKNQYIVTVVDEEFRSSCTRAEGDLELALRWALAGAVHDTALYLAKALFDELGLQGAFEDMPEEDALIGSLRAFLEAVQQRRDKTQ